MGEKKIEKGHGFIDISKYSHPVITRSLPINFRRTSDNAKIPYKKYDVDAGYDLFATWRDDFSTSKYIEYGTNIEMEIPDGYVGLIFPRSSVTNLDLILKNCVGVIDASYRGEIKFRFYELGGDFTYEIGDRVGQIVFLKLPDVVLTEVDELNETNRGANGYGSSGK